MKLRELINKTILLECKQSYIVVVDGNIDLTLSDIKNFSSVSLHKSDGRCFLSIFEKDNKILQIVFISKQKYHKLPFQIFIEKKANCTIISSNILVGEEKRQENSFVDLVVKEEARCNYISLLKKIEKEDNFKADVKNNGQLNVQGFYFGEKNQKVKCQINLFEEAKAYVHGFACLSEKQKVFINIEIKHQEKKSYSEQVIKSIALDESSLFCKGLVHIFSNSKLSVSKQYHHSLLLSKFANVKSLPYLKISSDDVNVSHGVTMSRLDKDALFYMQMRGISKTEAKKILLKSFYQEILDFVRVKNLYKILTAQIQKKVKGFV